MGDLMQGTQSFDQLLKKYNQFRTPAMKIKINGKDVVNSIKAAITNLDVTLQLDEASSANFSLVNLYDLESHAFTSGVKTNVVLGASVSIEIGYESNLTEVFYGYISNITKEFSDVPTISIIALDAKRLMMDNIRKNYCYEVKNYSDVASKLFGAYKKICKKKVIEATNDKLDQVMQNGSDYDFINNVLCKKGNREFLIIGSTVYFRKIGGSKSPITTLEWGKSLFSFSSSNSYCNEIVQVFGHDDAKKTPISVKKNVKSDPKAKAVISPLPIREIQATDIDNAKQANELLDHEATEKLQKMRSGEGSCIGLPELIPGRYLKIDKLEATINKTYYLNQVKHSFSTGGFTSEFEIGGWL